MNTMLLWKPGNLPWRAERHGSDSYVWYCVYDSYGNDIFTSAKAPAHDDGQLLGEIALLLTSINGTNVVSITKKGEAVNIAWRCNSDIQKRDVI